MANKTKRISIYVEAAEHKQIKLAATEHEESVSDYGRRVLLGHIAEHVHSRAPKIAMRSDD